MNSWKESLNSDGQQFHHYQQNEQSLLSFTNWTKTKTCIRNLGSGLGQAT